MASTMCLMSLLPSRAKEKKYGMVGDTLATIEKNLRKIENQ